MEESEVNEVLGDCLDPEDEDGFVNYARKYTWFFIRNLIIILII